MFKSRSRLVLMVGIGILLLGAFILVLSYYAFAQRWSRDSNEGNGRGLHAPFTTAHRASGMRAMRGTVPVSQPSRANGLPARDLMPVSRRIVLPDGEPAAGATIIMRAYTGIRLLQEQTLTAGNDGGFSIDVPTLNPADPQKPIAVYLLVMAPQCAPTFIVAFDGFPRSYAAFPINSEMVNLGPGKPTFQRTADGNLHLLPAYAITGTVVDEQGNAVPDAMVAVPLRLPVSQHSR